MYNEKTKASILKYMAANREKVKAQQAIYASSEKCKTQQATAHRERYQNDEVYRQKKIEQMREYQARKRAEKLAAKNEPVEQVVV